MKVVDYIEGFFNRIVKIFLSIFIPLLAFGLLVSLDKSFYRKKEFLGYMMTSGFTRKRITLICICEYLIIFLFAIIFGSLFSLFIVRLINYEIGIESIFLAKDFLSCILALASIGINVLVYLLLVFIFFTFELRKDALSLMENK